MSRIQACCYKFNKFEPAQIVTLLTNNNFKQCATIIVTLDVVTPATWLYITLETIVYMLNGWNFAYTTLKPEVLHLRC